MWLICQIMKFHFFGFKQLHHAFISLSNNVKEKSLLYERPVPLTDILKWILGVSAWQLLAESASFQNSHPSPTLSETRNISWKLDFQVTLEPFDCSHCQQLSAGGRCPDQASSTTRHLILKHADQREVGYFHCIHGNNVWFSCFSSLLKNCRIF